MRLASSSEDIGALKGLGEISEDVEDVEDGFRCICGASNIYFTLLAQVHGLRIERVRTSLYASNSLIRALGLVAFGNDWGNATASCAVTVLCHVVEALV